MGKQLRRQTGLEKLAEYVFEVLRHLIVLPNEINVDVGSLPGHARRSAVTDG
jgi:hypothetical protein